MMLHLGKHKFENSAVLSSAHGLIKLDKPRWYAVYTKPRSEKKVAERLIVNEIETYCPTYVTIRQWTDRRKKVILPVFVSYVFVHVNREDYSTVLKDPGVLNYVYHVGKPAIVPNVDMERLQRFLGDLQPDEQPIVSNLRVGDRVRIQEGPLTGKEGSLKDRTRRKAFLVLESLGLIVEIEIDKLQGL